MGRRRGLIKEAVREAAQKAWDRHRRHAHDLERMAPGAGELYLRRMTSTLDGLLEAELRKLCTSQDGEAR